MKNRKNILRIYIIIVVLIIATFSFFVMRTQAQDDIITDLSANLEALNVPLDAILIRSRNPFIVEIRLNMINEAGDSLTEDVWFIDLTNHEASTYRKSGIYLDGYYIALVSDSGKVFEYSYTGIHPDSPARVPFISDIAKLDGKQSEELLMDELDFGGMSVDELDVSLGAGSRLDVQTLTIRVSVPEVAAAVEGIPKFLSSINSKLSLINFENETTQIAIFRLWVMDESGEELFYYMKDLEAGRTSRKTDYKVIFDLFPHPPGPDDGSLITLTPSLKNTPTSVKEPPPFPSWQTQTPTSDPYP